MREILSPLFQPPWAPAVHYLLVLAIVYILSESILLRPVRLVLVSRSPKVFLPWVVGLIYCPRCMGFWIGGLLGYAFWGDAVLASILALVAVAEMKLTYSFISFELDPWVQKPQEEDSEESPT